MKKYFYIILVIILIVIILIGRAIFINNNTNNAEKIQNTGNTINIENQNMLDNKFDDKEQNIEVTIEEIENMKENINSTADTSIYQVEKEPSGRKILQIKPGVQFEVDLAGIVKNDKPEEKEIEELIKKVPANTGIWISNQSREKFIKLLNKNNMENFYITEEGYLKLEIQTKDVLSKKIGEMINSNKLYIINMTGTAYERDYISGKIVQYPFEDMDPTLIIEPYKYGDYIILEVTSNKKNKVTDKEILEAITRY